MPNENTAWVLEDFVDSLVVELDKTRETLAVKAINKPLSYTVKEVALDLNIFPSYDGDHVTFMTAQPGQQGASKVTIQLNSITDQQVRATTKVPTVSRSDLPIDDIGVDKSTKRQLRKLGVRSVDDLKNIQEKHVDLKQVSENDIDYSKLANEIQKARRNDDPPHVHAVSLSYDGDDEYLRVDGANLAVDPAFEPVAVVNEQLAEVMSRSARHLEIRMPEAHTLRADNELILTFDPYAVMRMNVRRDE